MMTKDTYYKSLQSLSKIVPHYSMKLFKDMVMMDLEPVTLRVCLSPFNTNRRREVISPNSREQNIDLKHNSVYN